MMHTLPILVPILVPENGNGSLLEGRNLLEKMETR